MRKRRAACLLILVATVVGRIASAESCDTITYATSDITFDQVTSEIDGDAISADPAGVDVYITAGFSPGLQDGWVRLNITRPDEKLTLTCSFRADGSAPITGTLAEICRCGFDMEPCISLDSVSDDLGITFDVLNGDGGTLSITTTEVSPTVLDIAVSLDADASFGLDYMTDASTQPTAMVKTAGLSAAVTRTVVAGDCSSGGCDCGGHYSGWLPGGG